MQHSDSSHRGTRPPSAAHPAWQAARRVVVKIGSALLVDKDTGRLRQSWFYSLIEDIAALRARGVEVIIVSSGAIALGRGVLRLAFDGRALRLDESQAAAAVGQIALARAYQEALATHDLSVAQLLLTADDTEQRRRYLNARSTVMTLLGWGAVPVVNENDTVATGEIRYGDNDQLAARVASMAEADCLVLLSDIDGLYTAPPHTDPDARRIDEVRAITPEIEAMAGDAGTALSRGGMVTKLKAGRIAMGAGANMVLTSGKPHHPLRQIDEGCAATWFVAGSNPAAARKRWISASLKPRGTLTIDGGAVRALRSGRSLLPAGVTAVSGAFQRGDAVVIVDDAGREVGRGLIAFSHTDAARVMGQKSSDITRILGYEGRPEIIHRDVLVVHPTTGDAADGAGQ